MRFLPIIDIDLSKVGEQQIRVTGANRLWLPPKLIRSVNGVPTLFTQVTDAVLAIRFEQTNELIPMGIGESLVNSFSGEFDTLFVTVIQTSATPNAHLYLLAGQDVTLAYGNSSGLSPEVGVGAGDYYGTNFASTARKTPYGGTIA